MVYGSCHRSGKSHRIHSEWKWGRLNVQIVWNVVGWVLGALLILAGIAYLGDSLYIRYEVAGANSAAAFGNVRFYYAANLKNGKVTIYQDSPQNEVCVHALFPHYGYRPCWFASRNTVRVVAGAARIAAIDFFHGWQ
jgi:hypothetical protein